MITPYFKHALQIILLCSAMHLTSFGQIFQPEGLNMPGTWNGFTNPPAEGSVFGSEPQVIDGGIRLIEQGTRRWQTTFSVGEEGDIAEGIYTWLFTSGPTGTPFQNKWANVNVITDEIQNYVLGGADDNSFEAIDNSYYTVNWQDQGYANTRAIFMRTETRPVDLVGLSANPSGIELNTNTPVEITVNLDGIPSFEERFYVRYSLDDFATSTLIELTVNGNSLEGELPAFPAGSNISYYVFSTTLDNPTTDFDMVSINIINNNGQNYSYSILEDPTLNVDLGPDVLACQGSGSVTLDAGVGYETYLWSSGETSQTIEVNASGVYTVTVTNDGLQAIDSVLVSYTTPFTFSLGEDISQCGSAPVTLTTGLGLFAEGDSITIIYDATQGVSGLAGAETVYMHSGATITPQGEWNYIAGNWGQDNGIGRMTSLGNNQWSITFNPQNYYGYPPGTTIAGLWMVFRNADGTLEGKDDNNQNIYVIINGNPPYSSSFDGVDVNFTASTFTSVLWSTGAGAPSIEVNQSGTYSVTVSDGVCSVSDTILVTFIDLPELDLGNDIIVCSLVEPVVLSANAGFDTYLWNTEETEATISISQAGTYSVSASLGDCSISDEVNVSLSQLATLVSLGADVNLCSNTPVTLSPGVSLSPEGDSLVIIYDATQGQSGLAGVTSVYMHSGYELVPFGGVVEWVGNWGQDDGLGRMTSLGNDTWRIAIQLYDYYSIEQGTPVNGLFLVFRNPDGTLEGKDDNGNDIFLNLSEVPPTSAFDGVTANFQTSTISSILWSTGESTSSIMVNQSGIYTVTVTDIGGCELSDEVEVTLAPSPVIDLGPSQEVCNTTPLVLDAGAGFSTYVWSTGATTQTINATTSASYSVSVTNEFGCEASDAVFIEVTAPATASFEFIETEALTILFTNNSTFGTSYAWDFNGDGITDNSNPGNVSFQYPSTGSYQVTLTVSNVCGQVTQTTTVDLIGVSTDNLSLENNLLAYPNPAADVLFIEATAPSEDYRFEVLDIQGKLITSGQFKGSRHFINLGTEFKSGTYILRLFSQSSLSTRRFVKI